MANAWTGGLPAVPMTRDHGCGGVVNGKLYILGGRQANITSQSPIVYEFTPGAGLWHGFSAMHTGVTGPRLTFPTVHSRSWRRSEPRLSPIMCLFAREPRVRQ